MLMTTAAQQRKISFPSFIWISSSLSLVVSPHLLHFSAWLSTLVIFVLLLKLITFKRKIVLNRFIIGALAFLALVGIVSEYGKILGRDAGVALLSIMLFLKLLETHTHRDAMVVMLLTYFLIITNFLYSQSIPMGMLMLLAVIYTNVALITLNQHSNIHLLKKVRMASTLVLMSIPVMMLLFILFPRIPGPLWGLPADAYGGKSGLSEQMTPGSISELALSDDVAFRAKFDGSTPSSSSLYWRGLVLWRFDGKSWTKGNMEFKQASKALNESLPVTYTVTLEPHNRHWLFLLDMPSPKTRFHDTLPLNQEYLLVSKQIISSLRQYKAQSFLQYRMNEALTTEIREIALELPFNFNPKTKNLAQSWKASRRTNEDIIHLALQMFYTENFVYTLKPPLLGEHSVDEFLFETRRGFCEHYASSFVVLMRAAGIPARIVVGYQGGEINPIDDYLIVRQADAHAWAEVWLEDKGWIRIDPTSAVSPARIETGLNAAINRLENTRLMFGHNPILISNLRLMWDAVNHRWNQWVLGYGPETQRRFLSLLGFSEQNLYHLGLVTVLSVSLMAMILTFFLLNRHPVITEDKIYKYYLLFCKKLSQAGFPRLIHEGPNDYVCRISAHLPQIQLELQTITAIYTKLRYTNESDVATERLFERAVKRLKINHQFDGDK